ncbi:uncharacterized protein N0V89_009773 [Didymosphaeria variabile]|uniref:Uncharacterized protein n=1 Tax=Didymosphaeria variabile TaxID=1932322 RepID=A0A9W8XFR9_9PLEO|nr:uncharacterized protein N0V89_009773 [Didymosphaeria variabile]KAJ4348399.1 hypothetical protein N0V89_009773 [Didymosphaeria variabile]
MIPSRARVLHAGAGFGRTTTPHCHSRTANVLREIRCGTTNTTKRWNASPKPVGQQAPESVTTIPGPSWLWLEPIYEPFRAYGRVQRRRPYMTQFVSSLVIYLVGDFVAQSIGLPAEVVESVDGEDEVEKGWVQAWAEERDWARTGRALLIGGAAAVPGYKWFLWLSNSFNYSSKTLSLATKVTVNQLLFTPLFNSYFFGMQSLLTGMTITETVERIKNTVPVSWINSCKLWPAVTAFSFAFIPIEYRSIFGGVIAIGWQTYLSLLNQRAAAEEELEHSHEDAKPLSIRRCEDDSGRDKEKCAA